MDCASDEAQQAENDCFNMLGEARRLVSQCNAEDNCAQAPDPKACYGDCGDCGMFCNFEYEEYCASVGGCSTNTQFDAANEVRVDCLARCELDLLNNYVSETAGSPE
jgi:hypothetical protein